MRCIIYILIGIVLLVSTSIGADTRTITLGNYTVTLPVEPSKKCINHICQDSEPNVTYSNHTSYNQTGGIASKRYTVSFFPNPSDNAKSYLMVEVSVTEFSKPIYTDQDHLAFSNSGCPSFLPDDVISQDVDGVQGKLAEFADLGFSGSQGYNTYSLIYQTDISSIGHGRAPTARAQVLVYVDGAASVFNNIAENIHVARKN